jgi:Asp/Glu/hydantoin racemase
MSPIRAAFADAWPEAETINLLDDGLSADRARETELSGAMIDRFVRFGRYGYDMGANGILVTCSAFGPAIDRLASEVPVPVLKPNEAMFEAAVACGQRIGMLATFGPSVATMTEEFNDYVTKVGSSAVLKTVLVEPAMDELRKGNADRHNKLLAARAPELADCDVIMLAHFSTSLAAADVRGVLSVPVLTAPHSAVERMRKVIEK